MSDTLVSPAVGMTMWVVSAAVGACCIRKVSRADSDYSIASKMGMLGAFIFAAQMINFAIPGTGSSGHLGGGLLLAVLLGPWAGFLTIASVLAIQALFFADGGIMAYGCNVFNLGLIPCFIAYTFVYRFFDSPSSPGGKGRVLAGSLLASVVGLQLGAFCVVLETLFSGRTELPFYEFVLLMQPIHLAIGVVEGIVTAAVIQFIRTMQPEWKPAGSLPATRPSGNRSTIAIIALTVMVAGVLSWFASSDPDGLEWSVAKTSGQEELSAPESGLYRTMASIQESLSVLPDYDFKKTGEGSGEETSWPNVNAGTTVSGLAGAGFLIVMAGVAGVVLRRKKEQPCR